MKQTRILIAAAALACLLPLRTASAEVTMADKTELLSQHSAWRAKYDVPPLVWDDAVALTAQKWADSIARFGTLTHRPDTLYGENIWTGTAGSFSMAAVVDAWGDEAKDFDPRTVTCAAGKACGHFTQIVWKTTTKLGCGKATGTDGNDYVVCNYDPAGNKAGQRPFGP
jgi:pathogenesis-related protein 1